MPELLVFMQYHKKCQTQVDWCTHSEVSMPTGAFPLRLDRGGTGIFASDTLAPGTFCLLDRRLKDPEFELPVLGLFSVEAAFRFRDEGVVTEAGFAVEAEAASSAAGAGAPDECATWPAA
jgi:hypothetical protein